MSDREHVAEYLKISEVNQL